MIKTNEVREGNLITCAEPAQATKVLTVKGRTAKDQILTEDLLGFDFIIFSDQAEGIPLTPEILAKMDPRGDAGDRFVFTNEIDFIIQEHFKTVYVESGFSCITVKNTQFVHQLQNLYFALTGEELDVKNLLK